MLTLNVAGRDIDNVFLVDDDPDIRCGYELAISDLYISTSEIPAVISVDQLVERAKESDGFICDLLLSKARYSPVNGDVIVSELYKRNVPAVLCSRNADTTNSVRRYRHLIPCVLTDTELNGDTLIKSFAICIDEFKGVFLDKRKPWHALVRVESIVAKHQDCARVALVIPSFDSSHPFEIDVSPSDMPFYNAMIHSLENGDAYRCKAQVNLEAEGWSDLYIKEWMKV